MIKEMHEKHHLIGDLLTVSKSESMIMEASRRRGNGAVTEKLPLTHKEETERKTRPPAWAFETLKPTPSETPSPKDYTP